MRVDRSSTRSSALVFSVRTSLSFRMSSNRSAFAMRAMLSISFCCDATTCIASSFASCAAWRSLLYFWARSSALPMRVESSSRRTSASDFSDLTSLSCRMSWNLSRLASCRFRWISCWRLETATIAPSCAAFAACISWLYFCALSSAFPKRTERSSTRFSALSFSVRTPRSWRCSWNFSLFASQEMRCISLSILPMVAMASSFSSTAACRSLLYFWALSSELPMRVARSSTRVSALSFSVLTSLSCLISWNFSAFASFAMESMRDCIAVTVNIASSCAACAACRSLLYFWALSSAFPMRVLMSSRRPSASVARDSISLRSLCRRKRSARASFSLRCMSFSSLLMVSFSCSSAPRADWTSWLYF
mmetsp:Transcript_43046/g.102185  ORF Transcript_43046/g.102185 Transcript_43046/m.102185 type:complete len:363 (-) Transcript_43046:450-1538(-)